MRSNETDNRRSSRTLGKSILASLPLVAIGALAASMLIPSLLGLRRYVIEGGSMAGSFDRGSVVYESVVPTAALRVGDVITYAPPRAGAHAAPVTHRIVSIARERSGARVFRTRGDANARPDPWRFTLRAPTQARAVFQIPYLGFVFAALALRPVRIAAIGIPALAIALAAAATLRLELRRRRRRWPSPAVAR